MYRQAHDIITCIGTYKYVNKYNENLLLLICSLTSVDYIDNYKTRVLDLVETILGIKELKWNVQNKSTLDVIYFIYHR